MESSITINEEKCLVDLTKNENLTNENKKLFLSLRKFSNLPSLIKEINKDKVYKLLPFVNNGSIKKNPDGTIVPILRDDKGQILEHGKLLETGIDFAKIAKSIATQSMLIYISAQIEDVKKSLKKIEIGQHNDRISEIEGTIKTCVDIGIDNMDKITCINLINNLNQGIEKLKKEFINKMNDIPKAEANIFDNWGKNKTILIQETIEQIKEAFFWILKGYKYLFELYSFYFNNSGDDNLKNPLKELNNFIQEINFDLLFTTSRALQFNKDNSPEKIWQKLKSNTNDIVNMNYIDLFSNSKTSYEIKITGKNLLEVLSEV